MQIWLNMSARGEDDDLRPFTSVWAPIKPFPSIYGEELMQWGGCASHFSIKM